jgi:hypothetical protein
MNISRASRGDERKLAAGVDRAAPGGQAHAEADRDADARSHSLLGAMGSFQEYIP